MPVPPQAFAKATKSNGLQFAAEFRIAEKDHLLPLDHSQGVILYDDYQSALKNRVSENFSSQPLVTEYLSVIRGSG